ncbi:MAG: 1,4-alpha-glucan branching protein GlgB [Deltaproteobacteria bacterium]|nr:1,4-alpha-glucan branching protein GlgB [Deltaproteobacteria bacterium]
MVASLIDDPRVVGDAKAVEGVVQSESRNPHMLLGAHPLTIEGRAGLVVRTFSPTTEKAFVCYGKKRRQMLRVHPEGIFAAFIEGETFPFSYQLELVQPDERVVKRSCPYAFAPTLGELDLHLSGEGSHTRLYEKLGAHPCTIEGVEGTSFAVWAPNAARVSVVGNFNDWDGRTHQMRVMGNSGIWEIFIPGILVGGIYKFELKLKDGTLRLKTDPVAFEMELRPKSASVVRGLGDYEWSDVAWMQRRKEADHRREAMAIYEVHLGSWRKKGEAPDDWYDYRELAPLLVEHCRAHSFTHLELLPIAEHAFDPSWGYQTTGYFAPTSRFGTPDDLRYFVDYCHQHGLGVILDWVPGHFPKDDFGLRWFDGTALYEHLDPREGEHRDWGTLIFNYGRNEVRAFLLSNAAYWLEQFHFDGLRVDAVASMIYKDYSREEGEWIPNEHGGRENLEAISFLQELNKLVYGEFPGVFTAAEESTAWSGVTLPVYLGGLGFGFKWNMGWMHDTLRYFGKDPIHRRYHHNDLTFSMLYTYAENFLLPLSHDEVVHGKGSLLDRMPGGEVEQAANLRLLLTYMYCHPGKKLLFQGGEFGQGREWDANGSVEWDLLQYPRHAGIAKLAKDLGELYLARDALWVWDTEPQGFSWIDCNDSDHSILSCLRRGPNSELICVFNFTPMVQKAYRIGVPRPGLYHERLNSDGEAYWGSNAGNGGEIQAEEIPFHGLPYSLSLVLPPLGALILENEDSVGEDQNTSENDVKG